MKKRNFLLAVVLMPLLLWAVPETRTMAAKAPETKTTTTVDDLDLLPNHSSIIN